MTLEQIESIFNKLQEGSSLSLQLLKIKVSAKNKTSYSTCKVNLSPEGRLTHFVGEISDHYKKEFKKYHTVKEYDGPHNPSPAAISCVAFSILLRFSAIEFFSAVSAFL